MRASHACDWDPGLSNNVTLNTMNTTQISEMETRKLCQPPLQLLWVYIFSKCHCVCFHKVCCVSLSLTPHFTSGDFRYFSALQLLAMCLHYTIPQYVQYFVMSKFTQPLGSYQILQHRYKIGMVKIWNVSPQSQCRKYWVIRKNGLKRIGLMATHYWLRSIEGGQ